MTCVISWGRCSLIRLLVVISFLVVMVVVTEIYINKLNI